MWKILSDYKVFLGYIKILDSKFFPFFCKLFKYIRIWIIFEYFLDERIIFDIRFVQFSSDEWYLIFDSSQNKYSFQHWLGGVRRSLEGLGGVRGSKEEEVRGIRRRCREKVGGIGRWRKDEFPRFQGPMVPKSQGPKVLGSQGTWSHLNWAWGSSCLLARFDQELIVNLIFKETDQYLENTLVLLWLKLLSNSSNT